MDRPLLPPTAGGWATLYGGPIAGGAAFGAARSLLNQSQQMAQGTQQDFNYWYLGRDTAIGAGSAAVAEIVPTPGIQGLNAGRGSFQAVSRQVVTKLENGTIQNITAATAGKIFVTQAYTGLPDAAVHGAADAAIDTVQDLVGPPASEAKGSSTGK